MCRQKRLAAGHGMELELELAIGAIVVAVVVLVVVALEVRRSESDVERWMVKQDCPPFAIF